MKLTKEERRSTIILELEKCDNTFKQVELIFNQQSWDLVADRLYFALYHAVCALLINGHYDVDTSNDAMEGFLRHYVNTGIFSSSDGELCSQVQHLREDAEYSVFVSVELHDVEGLITPTNQLIERIKAHLSV